MKIFLVFILLNSLAENIFSQGTAGSSCSIEPRFIIDMPTAGLIGHKTYAIDIDFYQSGGILFGFTIGLLNRFNIGASYGGSQIIGSSPPLWNKYPSINIKLRPIEESKLFPAIAIGFDIQGKENYIDTLNRFAIKSPGLFITTSKNFSIAGFLSIHGGINYSLESADLDKDLNLFMGIEKSIGTHISLISEYNFAINDNNPTGLGKGLGYLNLSMRCSLGKGFTFSINFKDFLNNKNNPKLTNRTVSIEYIG